MCVAQIYRLYELRKIEDVHPVIHPTNTESLFIEYMPLSLQDLVKSARNMHVVFHAITVLYKTAML